MDDMQKSDEPVVPTKSPNNTAQAEPEVMEGRGSAKGAYSGHRDQANRVIVIAQSGAS
jgi:hypothetical protein